MNINIILFTNRGGRVLSFKFNPLRTGLLVGTGVALLYVLGLYGGLQLGQDGSNNGKRWPRSSSCRLMMPASPPEPILMH